MFINIVIVEKSISLWNFIDSVLLGPSPMSLQTLLNICETYAKRYELSFNVKKTKVMCLKHKKMPNLSVPVFKLDGKELEVVNTHTRREKVVT